MSSSASWQTAYRHLFRHLDDPRELRRNPIAAQLGLDETTIRHAVAEALSGLVADAIARRDPEGAHRCQAIVGEHILARRAAETVAGELHLSIRQFYREKRRLCAGVARRLIAGSPQAHASARVALQAGVLALEQSRLLVEACQYELSSATLRDVAQRAPESRHQVEALCLLSEILTDQGEHVKAQKTLEEAHAVLAGSASANDESERKELLAELEVSSALLSLATGAIGDARRRANEATKTLASLVDRAERSRRLEARALVVGAQAAEFNGDYGGALQCYRDALATLRTLHVDAPYLRAKALASIGLTGSLVERGTHDDARSLVASGLDVAQQSGLSRVSIRLGANLALFDGYHGGAYRDAHDRMMECWHAALQTKDRLLVAEIALFLATLESSIGYYTSHRTLGGTRLNNALEHLRLAERLGTMQGLQAAYVARVKAALQLRLGEFAAAATTAKEAQRRAREAGSRHILGSSLRVLAEAYYAMGKRREASDAIGNSVTILERDGHLTALASAYHASSRITGSAKHSRLAAQIHQHV